MAIPQNTVLLQYGTAIQLTPHFTLQQMAITELRQYLAHNFEYAFRSANMQKLQILAQTLLEPVRAHFDSPVSIHSGIRMPVLNEAVGGSKDSQHIKAEAADFHVVGHTLPEVFNWIRRESALSFGQLILEGFPPAWIHLSLGPPWRSRKTGQVLRAKYNTEAYEWNYWPIAKDEEI